VPHSLTYEQQWYIRHVTSFTYLLTYSPRIQGHSQEYDLGRYKFWREAKALRPRQRHPVEVGWPPADSLTHISCHPSAEGRACDRESWPAKTDVLATVPRYRHTVMLNWSFCYRSVHILFLVYLWPYFAGKLSWHITTNQVNSALHPSMVAKSSTSFGWGIGGKVSAAGWQVTLCDPLYTISPFEIFLRQAK